jgi:hypothetical protein
MYINSAPPTNKNAIVDRKLFATGFIPEEESVSQVRNAVKAAIKTAIAKGQRFVQHSLHNFIASLVRKLVFGSDKESRIECVLI